jgi:hypothetical protein
MDAMAMSDASAHRHTAALEWIERHPRDRGILLLLPGESISAR